MPAVPGFRHDIFVSYAHADDVPVAGTQIGLVSQLVNDHRIEVGRKVGNTVDIWWDHYKLSGNTAVTPEIMAAAGDCACILVVASPAYLRSEWCGRERSAFLELLDKRQSGRAGAIFIASIEPLNQGKLPAGLADLPGYGFYRTIDNGRITRPLRTEFSEDRVPYCDQLSALAQNISNHLEGLKNARTEPTAKAVPVAASTVEIAAERPSVLLLEVTDDLVQRRAEAKTYLEQSGIVVLPEKRYSRDDMAVHRAQILADLARSRVGVQILGPLTGDRSDHPRGIVWLRYETIRDSGSQVPFIQWRDPDFSLDGAADPDARELLLPASVRTDRFPDFKRAIADLALKPPEKVAPTPEHGVVSVFVNSDLLDRNFGANVAKWLESKGFMVLEPPQSSQDAREEWETNLRYCDSLVLIYGQAKPSWIKTQLLLGNKVQRDTPLKMLCVCVAPPGEETRDKAQDLALRYSGIHYVRNDRSPELNQAELETFANRLRGAYA